MLHTLALETSGLTGSVAAAADGNVLAELQLDPRQRSAQSLAPAIRALLAQVGWRPPEVDLVAVAVGPGSFTGLRVGVATAKVLAYACEAEILGVSTLETIAAAAPPEVATVYVAIDAQRGEVVAQSFRHGPSGCQEAAGEPRLVPLENWLYELPQGSVVSGPVFKNNVPLPSGISVLDRELCLPVAANVARLAFRDYFAGRRDDLWNLLPIYSRPSAAEEKLGAGSQCLL